MPVIAASPKSKRTTSRFLVLPVVGTACPLYKSTRKEWLHIGVLYIGWWRPTGIEMKQNYVIVTLCIVTVDLDGAAVDSEAVKVSKT